MSKPTKATQIAQSVRTVALCYVRQSYTRDEEDMNSPERQRSNIQMLCERRGWTPEWYEDVGGHKSGRHVRNRPAWLNLSEQLSDPNVVAVVANDLSRLHRNVARISTLIEELEERSIALILAASNIEIDTSTIMGQMFAQFSGLMDAYYSKDISMKAKDSIEYRKRQGKVVGMPPFGTTRDEDGYLIPTPEGAWLLPDGRFTVGEADQPPEEEAIWRSYFECAKRILQVYVQNNLGLERIAYQLNTEGWAFRDRRGHPRPITRDDARRIVGNWPEYGGMVLGVRSKDRPAYESEIDLEHIPFIEERAVYPIELLKKVAVVRQERTVKPKRRGMARKNRTYILSGITYCSYCEEHADKHKNPKLRSRLGGITARGKRRYRHKAGVKCGAHNRSVFASELEEDFERLIKLLVVKPDALDLMVEMAIQADKARGVEMDVDPLEEQQKAIALCRRRIDAAKDLYLNGQLSKEDYWKRVQDNEREIAHWETRTEDTEKAALQLALCVDLLHNIGDAWAMGDDEERRALAESLFAEIIYDLDTRRIVDFKLKPMFDRFLVLRSHLDDTGSGEGGSSGSSGLVLDEQVSSSVIQTGVQDPLGAHPYPPLETVGIFLPRRVQARRCQRVTLSICLPTA